MGKGGNTALCADKCTENCAERNREGYDIRKGHESAGTGGRRQRQNGCRAGGGFLDDTKRLSGGDYGTDGGAGKAAL